MSKEKKRVPRLRFPGFTGDWEQREFSDIFAEVKSGLSRMLSNDDIGLPVVRANNINDGQLNLVDDIKYWYKNDPQGANTNNYLIEQGDILINFINSEAKMGTAAYVTRRPERDTIYTTNILRCKVNDEYNPYFIYSLTFLNSYKNYIASITKPAVNQASFTTVDFKKYSIKIPTVKEQNQIADLIETFNKLITLHQRKLNHLVLKKKSLLQKLFPKNEDRYPELRFPGFTDAWEQCKLRNLLEQPITDGPHETPELYNSGIPFISVDAIVDNKIDFTKMRGYISKEYDDICAKKYKPQINDVYLVKSGATIGKVAIVDTYDDFNIWSPLAAMRCGSITNPYFLYILLQTQDLQSQVFNKASHGTQPNLSMRQLEQFTCKVPKIEEQKLISRFLKQLDDVITLHQRKLDHLLLQKKALLQQMFV